MRAFRLLTCGAILFGLLDCLAATAFGQNSLAPSRNASITIVVIDPSGARIPNAEITIAGEKTVTTHAGPDGSKQVPLSNGAYTVTVSSPGFKTSRVSGVEVGAATSPVLRVILELAPTIDNYFLTPGIPTITSDLPGVIEPRADFDLPSPGGGFIGLAPLVYNQSFSACSARGTCTRRETFRADSATSSCYVLSVHNGDGRGVNQVGSYRLFLNGKPVLAVSAGRIAQATVKLRKRNSIKVALIGEPLSKLSISVARGHCPSK